MPRDEKVAGHGTAVPRGQDVDLGGGPPKGRFGQMFPDRPTCDVSDDAIDQLVRLMWGRALASKQGQNLSIRAGYTYLGQFIDHDITFDPTPLGKGMGDPRALVNFRTPRYDLDSLYGSGPRVQPFLYDWTESDPPGTKLLVGRNGYDGTRDLPRNQQGRALIGDGRNDENILVAQLHLLFIRFHNAVVDRLADQDGENRTELFEKAQRMVRWHYQWIVVNEFLPKVVGAKIAREVLTPGRKGDAPTVHRTHFKWKAGREPFIPVEFSGAAFRFGHSMVRDQYLLKHTTNGKKRPPRDLFPDLAGFKWLTEDLAIDWERFFELPGVEKQAQRSFQINTTLAKPMFKLPDGGSLPRSNLRRGRRLGLPSGQEVADAVEEDALPGEALLLDDQVPKRVQAELLEATPLWYYILCEAATAAGGGGDLPAGSHLGPVGGRIVAEVLVGLLEGDPSSYLREQPTWMPEFGRDKDFTMADLVDFVRRSES